MIWLLSKAALKKSIPRNNFWRLVSLTSDTISFFLKTLQVAYGYKTLTLACFQMNYYCCCCFLFEKDLICSLDCPETQYVDQVDSNSEILLSAGTKGVHHHLPPLSLSLNKTVMEAVF